MEADESNTPRKRGWSPERYSAVFAVLVSMTTLALLIAQTRLMQSQARASVWPHVTIGFSSNPSGFAWVVTNNGVGPAVIASVRITVDGKPHPDWNSVFHALGIDPSASFFSSQVSDTVITPAENTLDTYEILKIGPGPAAATMATAVSRVSIALCYCSIYNECWTTEFKQRVRQALTECPVPDATDFRQ